ncbi:MAG: hypothetical protein IH586_12410 [Anaerolineaceae bacterium]|nr:hypothetical protein [Anaerolineaceae bacterium]
MSDIDTEIMYFNGVDGTTGQYSLPPITPQQFSDAITGTSPEKDPDQEALTYWYEQYVKSGHYGIKEGHDPKKLEESGWGVIFTHDADPALIDALRPLLDWRKSQAGEYYKEYSGGMGGFRPNDNKSSWLGRQGGSVGPADPEKVPYYLLIVGSPEQIPYRFQTLLDVQYAVGRIHFDTLAEYAQYAQSVVTAEKQQVRLPRRMTFFGVANPDDPATRLSSEQLVAPLLESLSNAKQDIPWEFQSFVRDQATKSGLGKIMSGSNVPGLLFTASHGMGFPRDDKRQLRHQGALLCQDWPGPKKSQGPVSEDFYFSADDLTSDTNLLGMIAFFFACYGAGTPQLDEFAQQAFKDKRMEIAPQPFVASLPRRMLSMPKGGALAVVGHVERAWGHSFFWGKNRSLTTFESAMLSLMNGYPIGYAFECFNERYAEISTELTSVLEDVQFGLTVEPLEMASKWTANNDSKNYVVLGDPAVRMMVADETGASVPERPSILVSTPPGSSGNSANFSTPPQENLSAKKPGPGEDTPQAPEPAGSTESVHFDINQAPQPVVAQTGTTQEMLKKLVTFLGQAIDSAATLDVRTYTSDQVDKVNLNLAGKLEGANLRAMTVIKILGDIEQVVPVEDGEVNHDLWEIHQETVRQAQASRNNLIRDAMSAAANLANLRINR